MSSFPWPVYLRPLKPKNAESWQVSVMTALQFKEGVNAPGIIPQKKQLLIHVVDGMAKARPEALFAEYPISATTYADGDLKITYDSLANAVNGVAWWLNRELGPGKDFETLAYIGPNDVRYNAMILGAVKAGYKILLTSPRNSIPAHVNMINILNCRTLLAADLHAPALSPILAAHPLRALQVPSVKELLNTRYPYYPFNKTFKDA
ncbi:hypothetical protein MMC20_007199 [Loxospora ochrophaea]|nr:hypothetical protein [Loxospora ochrophaea]